MYKINRLLLNIAILIGAVSLSSCSDFLKVDPSDQIPNGTAVTTVGEAEAALVGIFPGFIDPEYYGADMITYGDVRGDDMAARTTSRTYSQFTFGHASPLTSTNGGYFWQYIYKNLNRATSLITKINEGAVVLKEDGEKVQLNQVKGEALTLRALMHFDLVKVYGEPYIKNPNAWGVVISDKVYGKDDKPKRSTVKQTYDFIVNDLKEALGIGTNVVLLKKNIVNGRVNYYAAKALLAKVCLYMGDYENAYTYAKDVIENGGYSLISNANYVNSWSSEFTTESVFEIHVSETQNPDREGMGFLWSTSGYAASIVTQSLLDLLGEDPNDIRGNVLVKATLPTGVPGYFVNKYPGRSGNIYVNNIRIIRLSEVYLIAAEAGVRTGKTDASTYLNDIRLRANPQATTVTATLELVMNERRKELFGEGQRFFDITRDLGTNVVKRVGYAGAIELTRENQVLELSWNNKQTYLHILPIPQAEKDINPEIQQNEGY